MNDNNNQVTTAKDLRALISGDAMRKQFAMALPRVMPIDAFVRSIMTAVGKTPELLDCAQDTVLAGCMTAASLGLSIDPTMGRAYLIPFKDNRRGCKVAQFVVGYKGYVDLFYRSGMAAGIQAEAVFEKDYFDYALGLNPKLDHIPSEDEDRGAIRYAYAIGSLANGGKVWKVLNRGQVMKAKKFSRGSDSPYSPWQTSEAEMWAKTAIRALSDLLPLSPELQAAVAQIDAHERDFANAVDLSGQATVRNDPPADKKEIAKDAPPSGSLPAGLTPVQQLNAAMLEAGQIGIKQAEIQAILDKAAKGKPIINFTDFEAQGAIQDIKMAIRVIVEKP